MIPPILKNASLAMNIAAIVHPLMRIHAKDVLRVTSSKKRSLPAKTTAHCTNLVMTQTLKLLFAMTAFSAAVSAMAVVPISVQLV